MSVNDDDGWAKYKCKRYEHNIQVILERKLHAIQIEGSFP